MSEFDKVCVCDKCPISEFCESMPEDLSCGDVQEAAKVEGLDVSGVPEP